MTLYQKRLYFVSILFAVLAAIFWCFFNFLAAEDATVLFNRFNHLQGAPIFFYYAGYSSAFPQGIAYALSPLSFPLQAALYSFVALFIFIMLIREVFLITRSGFLVIILISVCAIFYPAAIYNLTSSFWPGLMLVGLIGLRTQLSCSRFSWLEAMACIPGVAGSPLAIAFSPLYAWISINKKSWPACVVTFATILSYAILANHSGPRVDTDGLFTSLAQNLVLTLKSPLEYLLNFASPGDLMMSILGVGSVPLTAALAFYFFKLRHNGWIPIALFSVGSLLLLGISMAASAIPLQGRYWFPNFVAGVSLLGLFLFKTGYTDKAKKLQIFIISIILILVVTSFFYRTDRWGGIHTGLREWRVLAHHDPMVTSIIRERHADGGRWAIGAGAFSMSYSECGRMTMHPYSIERYGFRIYCGENGSDTVRPMR